MNLKIQEINIIEIIMQVRIQYIKVFNISYQKTNNEKNYNFVTLFYFRNCGEL